MSHEQITTARTVVRATTASDLATLRSFFDDPEVNEHWGGRPLSDAEILAKYTGARRPQVECLIIEQDGTPVGLVQYHLADDEGGGLDLVLVPAARGQGLGSEVVTAMVTHLRERRGWSRITVDPDMSNRRGIDFWTTVGFELTRIVDADGEREPYALMTWPTPTVKFAALRTPRLLVREMRGDDAAALYQRRNDPEVARFQDWTTPYPLQRAEDLVAEVAAMDGPTVGRWWMATIADPDDTVDFGDVGLHLRDDGHTAEIGYTLARDAWGNGYAVEAAEALVEYLFDTVGVTRIEGKLHPDNPASAMVLERLGMVFEGHTKLSFWIGGDNSDDWIYGMTRDDWVAWRDRPRHRPVDVRLVEITPDNLATVERLVTHRTQHRFVSPVPASFGDALFPEVVAGAPLVPWMRAIEADGALVGFVMVALRTDAHPEPYLWRLLVDRRHQRRGIGRAALDAVVEQCRAWGDHSLVTSWVPGKGSPEPMYLRYGFVPTGEIVDGEIEGRLTIES